jgi:ABC-type branched-subunit amino acid transport system substrate-binding protein
VHGYKRVRFVLLPALLVFSVALAACGSSSSSSSASSGSQSSSSTASSGAAQTSSSTPFRVYFVGPQSGPLGAYTAEFTTGLKAAANVLNSSGGIDGHKLVITTGDDGNNVTQGISLLESALGGSNPPNVVIPGITPNENIGMLPLLMQKHVLSVSSNNNPIVSGPPKYPYLFMSNPAYQADWARIVPATVAAGYKTVEILAPNELAGQTNVKIAEADAKAAGLKVLGAQLFDPTALDITPVWLKIAAAHPDVVWESDTGESPVVYKSRGKAGVTIPTISDTSAAATPLAELVPHAALVNAWACAMPIQYTAPAQRTPGEAQYAQALAAEGGAVDAHIPTLTYDPMMAIAAAAKQAHSIDTDQLVNALIHLTGNTSFGAGYPYRYSDNWRFSVQQDQTSPYQLVPLTAPLKGGYLITKPVSVPKATGA